MPFPRSRHEKRGLQIFAICTAGALLVGMGCYFGVMAKRAFELRNFQAVNAILTHVAIKPGMNKYAGDMEIVKTCDIAARYVYSFGDREYESDRVLFNENANLPRETADVVYNELHELTLSKNPIECYVDSTNPSRSFLFKQRVALPWWFWRTWWILYLLSFLVVGFFFKPLPDPEPDYSYSLSRYEGFDTYSIPPKSFREMLDQLFTNFVDAWRHFRQ